jgi:hypothetical protein
MEKHEFLDQLKVLTNTEELLVVSAEVNELKTKFLDFLLEKERLKQVAVLEAAGDLSEVPNETVDPIKEEFFAIYSEYKAKITAFKTTQKLEQEANLRLKQNLTSRLRDLIQNEENIGVAVSTYKEIHEHWKKVGDIPRDKRQDVQNEYSKLLESFFFNLKIYRELKDHDLKRNTQLKQELVLKIQELQKQDSIKELESSIKSIQNEFDEIGPVLQDEWEAIKTAYWDGVKAIYAKIHTHYEKKREELKVNIEKKAELLAKTTDFVVANETNSGIKEWEDKTKELLAFQDEWKKIGFGTKKENEELWQAFRSQCNVFFENKKIFFDGLKVENNKIADLKRVLIERANTLKESQDWKNTGSALIKLQQDWKNLGHAGQKLEQILWKEFRAACDYFFNTKDSHFAELDKANETNLAEKKALILEIESYKVLPDKKKSLNDLKEFSTKFNAIGNVPFKEKDSVYKSFKTALDTLYSDLKLEGAEKEKAYFQAKVDSLKANPNSERLLDKEKKDLNQQIANLKQEINLFENNLGFFANSKGADALKKDVEQKITIAKNKIEEYKQKIKQLVHE